MSTRIQIICTPPRRPGGVTSRGILINDPYPTLTDCTVLVNGEMLDNVTRIVVTAEPNEPVRAVIEVAGVELQLDGVSL